MALVKNINKKKKTITKAMHFCWVKSERHSKILRKEDGRRNSHKKAAKQPKKL